MKTFRAHMAALIKARRKSRYPLRKKRFDYAMYHVRRGLMWSFAPRLTYHHRRGMMFDQTVDKRDPFWPSRCTYFLSYRPK